MSRCGCFRQPSLTKPANPGSEHIDIETGEVIETAAATHLRFRLVKQDKGEVAMADNNMTETTKSGKQHDLIVTRAFDAPVELVWKAWSDAEQVMRWWGPKGFTSPSAEMDFREGGTSLVCMRAPKEFGGQDMYNTWAYRKIDPHKLIEFILNFTDKDGTKLDPTNMGMPAGIPQDVRHVITFKAVGDNRTEMTVTEYGYTSDQAHDLSKAGLEQCLDKMAEVVAKD